MLNSTVKYCTKRGGNKQYKSSNSRLWTHHLFGEDEAGNVGDVEEEVAHDVRGLGVRHLEAGAEPLVAAAVHHGVDPHVGQAILGLSWLYTDGAP